MITKDTSITIKFCADVFSVNPTRGVRFQIFDENNVPMEINYDIEGLCSIDDERISGLHIALTCVKKLFDKIVEHRHQQLNKLAKEIGNITGESVKYSQLPTAIGPTGMSHHLPGTEDNQLPPT